MPTSQTHTTLSVRRPVFLVLVLANLSLPALVIAEESPVFVNIFVHAVDPINLELSHKHILRITRLFDQVGVQADLYFRGPLLDTFANDQQEPDLVPFLRTFFRGEKGNGIGYIGYVHHPLPRELAERMNWGEALDLCRRYLFRRANIFTGQIDDSEIGGAELAADLFGRPVDIARRHHLVQEVLLLREQGAIVTLGHFRNDFVTDFAPRPLAWYLGMLAVVNYRIQSSPTGGNVVGLHSFGDTAEEARRAIHKMINQRPDNQAHFFYLGNHNVDMYADNGKWNALRRGHPNHVENWAYTDTVNPKNRESARLPSEFLLNSTQIENRYRLREAQLRALKEASDKDPDVHLLGARGMYDLLKGELAFSVDSEDLDKACEAIVALPDECLPPFIQLDRERCLTLAEAFDLLVRSLTEFGKGRNWPENLRPNARTLGPTSIPDCWKEESPPGTSSLSMSQQDVLEMANRLVSFKASFASDPEIPAQFSPASEEKPLNAATCLYAMARAYRSLRQSRTEEIDLPRVDMVPKPPGPQARKWISDAKARDLPLIDQYHLLQIWTIKPVLFAGVGG